MCRPMCLLYIDAADVAVLAADVRDVYTDYTRPMCRVDVVDVADVQADVRDVYTDYTRPMCRVDVVDVADVLAVYTGLPWI